MVLAWTAVLAPAIAAQAGLAVITVDYPVTGSLFPPEIAPPTFLWRDSAVGANAWVITVRFDSRARTIRRTTAGELMRVGDIDPRCVTPTNTPTLTAEQTVTRTWTPDESTWAAVKKHSVARSATVTITGFASPESKEPLSSGEVTIRTSKDPVGAPVFYRDVPLMPTEGEQGAIKPLPQSAIGLIKWRLRDIGEPRSKTLMEGLPTCANCHSFSRDGRTLGLDVDGPQNDKGLYALVPVKKETTIRNEDVIKWSSFGAKLGGKLRAAFMSQVSPDGRHVVTTIEDPRTRTPEQRDDLFDKYYSANFKDHRFLQVFYPTRGVLAWYSRESGTLTPLPGADDPRYVQTDGVWSPDGRYIVFARARAKSPYPEGWKPAEYANDPNETPIRYDLYRMPFNEGKGGTPEPVAGASGNGMSNNFPKVSPDGRWIVFVKCLNGQLMRPDSQLFIVPFAGGEARRMNCNTPLMNSWHSFSPNGRWLVFSSKSRSPFTQMYLTHIDDEGNDSPPILVENATAANRAVNIPEFVNVAPDGLSKIEAPATDFYRIFDSALELMRNEKYADAAREWRKAVLLNPEEARATFNLALSLERDDHPGEAVAQYRRTIELDPNNSGAYTNLGIILAREGKLVEAVGYFEKCVTLDPRSARARNNLGSALAGISRIAEALEHCRMAVALDPQYAEARNSLGLALARADRLDEAVSELEKAVELEPDSFEYRFNLARFLAAGQKFEPALPHFEQAVQLSGGREPLALSLLAGVYGDLGRYAEALETARRALELALQKNDSELASELTARIDAYQARVSGRQ
jgi:Flp pilus assembly protein TadD